MYAKIHITHGTILSKHSTVVEAVQAARDGNQALKEQGHKGIVYGVEALDSDGEIRAMTPAERMEYQREMYMR